MPANEYGKALPKFSVNLLVRDMGNSVRFYRDVVGANVRYADGDFAALELKGWDFMLHADHSCDHHPLCSRLSGAGLRGMGRSYDFWALIRTRLKSGRCGRGLQYCSQQRVFRMGGGNSRSWTRTDTFGRWVWRLRLKVRLFSLLVGTIGYRHCD